MLPILYQSPNLTLYSYPLLMGLGWGIAYQVFFGLLPSDLARWRGLILYWGIFLSAWMGAKFLFMLTLPTELGQSLMSELSFWTGGGFVFYGGFLGGAFFLLLLKLIKFPLSVKVLWPIVPAICIGHAIGRIGCFLAGCCYGDVTTWWWGVHLHGDDRHPTQLLETIGLGFLAFHLFRSKRAKEELVGHYLLGYGVLRFFIEILRGDQIRGYWGPLTPSQWISIVLIVAGVLIKFRFKANSPSHPKH